MVALVIPNALQVVVQGRNAGTTWVNTWGLTADGDFLMSQGEADLIQAAFHASYAQLRPDLSTGWYLDSMLVRDLRTATSPTYEPEVVPYQGLSSVDPMPPQMAIVASHSTGFRGKSYRGRTYLCGFTESGNSGNGEITTALRGVVVDMVDYLKNAIATGPTASYQLAVLSRKLLEANPVVATTVDVEWDRQDRRKRR